MKLSELKPKDGNPRYIKDDKFDLLVKSIIEFPKMMPLRPIVFDPESDNESLGGNMRYRALCEINNLGREEILSRLIEAKKPSNIDLLEPLFKGDIPEGWVRDAAGLTPEEKERFIIVDNTPFGGWDFDLLANQWEQETLEGWGLDVDFPEEEEEEDETEPIGAAFIELKVKFTSTEEMKELYNELLDRGYECEVKEAK